MPHLKNWVSKKHPNHTSNEDYLYSYDENNLRFFLFSLDDKTAIFHIVITIIQPDINIDKTENDLIKTANEINCETPFGNFEIKRTDDDRLLVKFKISAFLTDESEFSDSFLDEMEQKCRIIIATNIEKFKSCIPSKN